DPWLNFGCGRSLPSKNLPSRGAADLKLHDFLAEFKDAEPVEALEMLVDFSEKLPPLSPGRAVEGEPPHCRIQECQTPVYLWFDVEEGRIRLEAMVPEKSPTVRGFV